MSKAPSTASVTALGSVGAVLLSVAVVIAGVPGCQSAADGGAPTLRPIWTVEGGSVRSGPPVAADGAAFAADEAGTLRAFDVQTGAVRWQVELSGATAGAPVVNAARVFVVTRSGVIASFDLATGTLAWSVSLGADVTAGLALAAERLFAVTAAGEATGLSAGSGDRLWTTDLGAAAVVRPGASEAALLVVTLDGRVTRLDAASGARSWEVTPDPGYVIGTPLTFESRVVVPGYEDTLYGLSFDDGSTAWSHYGGNYLVALPVLGDGVVYFGAAQGAVRAVDPVAGELRWEVPGVLFGRQAILLVSADALLVVDQGGPVTWIDRLAGTRTATLELGTEVDAVALAEDDQVLVVAAGTTLRGFSLTPM